MTHRVVVSGIGLITPLGTGARAAWTSLIARDVAVRQISRFDASTFPTRVAAQIDDFDPRDYLEAKRRRWTDRFSQLAVASADLALRDAGFATNGPRYDAGVYIGSALGGVACAEEEHTRFVHEGLRRTHPLVAISVFAGAATANVAIESGFCGPNIANGNSCAAGAVAIGEAFRAVARGDVRVALAGGVEAPLAPLAFGAFAIINAMTRRNDDPSRASRPFDRERDGFVMAEGAGMLFLERYDDAMRRDAPIYGEIVGYGLTNDAHHMTMPRPDGSAALAAMRSALGEAALGPDEIELINAHGSSTPLNDKTETLAIRTLLGDGARTMPVTASKGQHGHALGASGAWEAAFSLLAMRERLVPSVVNLLVDDPECDLAYVREPRPLTARTVLSNSFGFGGINATLVFRDGSR